MPSFRSSFGTLFWGRVSLLFLVLGFSFGVWGSEAEVGNDGSINSINNEKDGMSFDPSKQYMIRFSNKSKYRIDIHFDDGKKGIKITTAEAGQEKAIKSHMGHRFFITKYGIREGLFDPDTDTPYIFKVSYPEQVFVIPESAAPSKNPCQDRFSYCTQKAANGHCTAFPGWMIVNCCKSCDEEINSSHLIDPKVRCTRESLNISGIPAWRPGDLHRLFTSWATDNRYTKYDPKILSSPDGAFGGKSGPWVVVFDNFLTDDETDALIEGGRLEGFKRSADQGSANDLGEKQSVISQNRTSSNAWCRSRCESLPGVESVNQKIEQVTGIGRTNFEKIQVLEYNAHQFYRKHHDASKVDNSLAGQRIMTFFLYLSNVEEGGETYFNELDIAVKPKKGRALVWPSVMDKDPDFWDNRTYHEAKEVITGTKHAANHWIHMYDFQTPLRWGCTGSFK